MSQREDAAEPLPIVTLRPIVAAHRPPISRARSRRRRASREIYEALILGTRDYVRKNDFDPRALWD